MTETYLVPVNNGSSTLDGDLAINGLSFSVATGGGAQFGSSFPMRITIGSEILEVSARSGDNFTVASVAKRGLEGTAAAAHYDGDAVYAYVTAGMLSQLQDKLSDIEAFIVAMTGGGEGVQRVTGTSDLAVIQTTPAGMTVEVGTGYAIVDGEAVRVTAATETATITAPVTNPRIDRVTIDNDGNVEVVTGTEAAVPSAPAVPADALSLAQIALTVAMTEIETADITDERVYI